MNNNGFFQSLLTATDTAIGNFVFNTWNAFNGIGNKWIHSMMIIFVAVIGYLFLIGRIQMTLAELFPRVLKGTIIYVLVTNVGILIETVYELFFKVPEALGNFLVARTGRNDATVNGMVEDVWSRGMRAAELMMKGGITKFGTWLMGIGVAGVTIAMVMFAAFLIMLSKLAVGVLLGLAPFFLVIYLFEAFKPVFEGYLRQLITFALTPVFIYGLLALLLSIMDTASDKLDEAAKNDAVSFTQVGPFAVVMLISLLLTKQVMGWAAGIAGGFSLSSVGAMAASIAAGKGTLAGGQMAGGGAKWLANTKGAKALGGALKSGGAKALQKFLGRRGGGGGS